MGVLIALFWGAPALLLATSGLRPDLDRRMPLQVATAGLLIATLAVQHGRHGVLPESPAGVGVSLVLLLAAAALLLPRLRAPLQSTDNPVATESGPS